MMQEMKTMMADFVRMEAETQQYVAALNHVKSMNDQLDEGSTLKSVFDGYMTKHKSKKGIDVTRHDKYRAMMEEFQNQDGDIETQLESLKSQLLGQTEDEDVAVTQAEVNIKCPYTGQNMVDPVRNEICGHIYDHKGILGHIKAKKNRAKCPVGGCVNAEPITEENLTEYKEMKRYIMLLNKKRQS